ncbi:uncharacterized protein [Drosophila takahashii]|uniref:uncharacterized protein n=1 Tax=Drosophila takahashii TaxID=29030 RepID=UPI001CF89685|nr:uncharacterized protein LOC108065324 [Drosophila takahashii]
MADAIRCACDSFNSVVDYLVTMRICEIRHCLEFLGVAHTEVLAGVVLFILMQFTKFTAVLLLAILLAYGIFYLWETFFPEISQFGHRGMKMFRNVRTSANLPPFSSDTEDSPGEYLISPKVKQYTSGLMTPPNNLNMPMLLPVLQTKNLRTTSLQTDARKRQDEENRRGSRGSRGRSAQRESQDAGKHRKDRPYWRSVNSESEQPHSSKRTHQGGGGSAPPGGSGESKRMANVMRIPTITSGIVETKRLSKVTSEQLKRLPNITSGEYRRISNEARKLHNITSGEITESRRVPKVTSHTQESRWLPQLTSGEMKESRKVQKITSNTNESRGLTNITSIEMRDNQRESRRESRRLPGEIKETRRSSHPPGTGESRRPSNNHRDGGGGSESKSRRPAEKSYPPQSRRPEEPSKQRRSNNWHSGVTRRPFPDDHFERLKLENREFQARRLQASGAAGFRSPTSEGAMLTKQDNFIGNHRQFDKREAQRNFKSSNPNKDANHRYRQHRSPNPIL